MVDPRERGTETTAYANVEVRKIVVIGVLLRESKWGCCGFFGGQIALKAPGGLADGPGGRARLPGAVQYGQRAPGAICEPGKAMLRFGGAGSHIVMPERPQLSRMGNEKPESRRSAPTPGTIGTALTSHVGGVGLKAVGTAQLRRSRSVTQSVTAKDAALEVPESDAHMGDDRGQRGQEEILPAAGRLLERKRFTMATMRTSGDWPPQRGAA